MATQRRCFFSFHYELDAWRASQIRNMGVAERNKPVSDNDWETIKKGDDAAIKKWINEQLTGKSCTIVLIGSQTASRKWIKYEIKKSWDDKKSLLGIHIHNLKDQDGKQTSKGANPLAGVIINGTPLSSIVKTYNPPYRTSVYVYAHIKDHLSQWVEEAIRIRNVY